MTPTSLYTHAHVCIHIHENMYTLHTGRRKVCVEETGLQQQRVLTELPVRVSKWVREKESQCCSRKSSSSLEQGVWGGEARVA